MTERTVLRADRVAPEPSSAPAPTRGPRKPRRTGRAGITRTKGSLVAVGRWWTRVIQPVQLRWEDATEYLAPVRARVSTALGVVSPLGWTLLVGAIAAWLLADRLGWAEFGYVAAVFGIILVLSAMFTFGRLRLDVERIVAPLRVRVGEAAAAQLQITNRAATPLLPIGVEMPVGSAVARYTTPILKPGASYEELALIPTERRGVVVIGSVTTQRGDPFGVFRREVAWTDPIEMFVHPRTVPLEPLGSGWLRDLEGQTTNEVSMSDLAFHTLREYVPGDDRRYIHWRSSAKASAAAGTGSFLVRQFLDTRRSHVAVIVDVNPRAYSTPEEFELAIAAGASVALRAITDEMDLSIVCGENAALAPVPQKALDTFSRAELSDWTLARATGKLATLAPDASVVLLITGPATEFADLRHARALLPHEVNTIGLQVQEGAPTSLRQVAGFPLIGIGSLADLAPVLATGGVQ